MNLKVAEQFIGEFGNLAKVNNTMIIPADMGNIGGMVAAATSIIKTTSGSDSKRKGCREDMEFSIEQALTEKVEQGLAEARRSRDTDG